MAHIKKPLTPQQHEWFATLAVAICYGSVFLFGLFHLMGYY